MKKNTLVIPALALLISPLISCKNGKTIADLVVYNNIYTAENSACVEAFAVKNGKYIYVGSKDRIKDFIEEGKTKIIDGNNQGLVIPGCTEGHAHYFSGVGLNSQLPGSDKSYEEILEILENKFKNEHIKQFVSFGWEATSLSERINQGFNFAKEIENKAPGIPVILIDNSGHGAVCNETALKVSGLTKENHYVRGGEVYLDKEGELSGYINDQSLYFVIEKSISKPFSDNLYKNACEYGMNELLKLGYTNALDAFTNMYDPTGLYNALKTMDDEHELKMNIAECFNVKSYDSSIYKDKIDEAKNIADKYSSKHCNPTFVKLFTDGVVEAGTGWIFDTYAYAEEGLEHGNIIWDKSELNSIVSYANSKDLTIHAHTYGDAACNAAIDAFIASNNANGGQYRNCLAHVRNITEEDAIRAAENKIPVAANLLWHTDYGPDMQFFKDYIIGNIGEDLYYSGYPMKSLVDKGIIVSSSTDAPAAASISANILNVIEVATTGVEPELNDPPFSTNELLTIEESLDALTINGAWQLGLENERGSIKVGKYADFVILDTNILNYHGEQLKNIHKAKILNTYFEGENVYSQNN